MFKKSLILKKDGVVETVGLSGERSPLPWAALIAPLGDGLYLIDASKDDNISVSKATVADITELTMPTDVNVFTVDITTDKSMRHVMNRYMEFILDKCKNHRQAAARILGISTKTIYNRAGSKKGW